MPKLRHSSAAHRARTAQMRYYTRYRVASVARTSSDSSQSTVDPSPAATTCRRPYIIKQARSGDKLEVMLGKQSEISDCTDMFDISEVEDKISQLTDLHDLPEYSRVSICIKVLDVADLHTMQGGKTTQNVVIADRTSRTEFTLWEEHVGKLQKDKSYHLKYMLLRIYGGESYLATAKHDSDIIPIEDIDIGNIDLTCTEDTTLPNIINNVKVVAIDTLTRSDGCIQCGHSISTVTEEEEFGECTKCGLLQCREECKSNLAAHFTIKF